MQDLRKKLLEAGVVDKKKARRAKAEARKAKKARGGDPSGAKAEAERAARHAERQAKQAADARAAQARHDTERAAVERTHALRDLIEREADRKIAGDERFHFAGPDRRIRRISVKPAVARKLVDGALAIVYAAHDAERDYRVVPAKVAGRVAEIAPETVLFWNASGADSDGPA